MTKYRLTVMLPIISVLITLGLWLWSRQQYRAVVHSKSQAGWLMWTDYTPVPLEIAGAINVPIATFGYPLYHLVHDETKTWTLNALLFGVTVQWAYIGFAVDTRKTPYKGARLRHVVGAVGVLFGVFVLTVTIPMHHVAPIYKAAAAMWSLVICVHSVNVFRHRPSVPRSLA